MVRTILSFGFVILLFAALDATFPRAFRQQETPDSTPAVVTMAGRWIVFDPAGREKHIKNSLSDGDHGQMVYQSIRIEGDCVHVVVKSPRWAAQDGDTQITHSQVLLQWGQARDEQVRRVQYEEVDGMILASFTQAGNCFQWAAASNNVPSPR